MMTPDHIPHINFNMQLIVLLCIIIPFFCLCFYARKNIDLYATVLFQEDKRIVLSLSLSLCACVCVCVCVFLSLSFNAFP